MPRTSTPKKPEAEMTALELAEHKTKLAWLSFLKSPNTANRTALVAHLDTYSKTYAAQFN